MIQKWKFRYGHYKFFFIAFLADTFHMSYIGATGSPVFGFLVMSPLGFKARVVFALFALWGFMWCIFPEIHLWCYTLATCWQSRYRGPMLPPKPHLRIEPQPYTANITLISINLSGNCFKTLVIHFFLSTKTKSSNGHVALISFVPYLGFLWWNDVDDPICHYI